MPSSRGSRSSHILVVDDHADSREKIVADLGRRYTVRTAVNGAQAIVKTMGAAYDLIVLDDEMPAMEGSQLIRELRSLGVTTPIIMFSGNPSSLEAQIRLRIAGVLQKPYQTGELDSLVARILLRPSAGENARPAHQHEDALLSPEPSAHLMLESRDRDAVRESVCTYLRAGLVRGERVIAIAPPKALKRFEDRLASEGIRVADSKRREDLVLIEDSTVRYGILTQGAFDRSKAGRLIARILEGPPGDTRPVRVYGDVVHQLAAEGHVRDSGLLEEEWNWQLSRHPRCSALCGYLQGSYRGVEGRRVLDSTRALHSHILQS